MCVVCGVCGWFLCLVCVCVVCVFGMCVWYVCGVWCVSHVAVSYVCELVSVQLLWECFSAGHVMRLCADV